MNTTKNNISPMQKITTLLIAFLLIVPALSSAQTIITITKNHKKNNSAEVKIIACNQTPTMEMKSEAKSQNNILDILQKESEETVIYPLVQLAHKIREKIQTMDKKNMVSSGSAGTEGEAGGGPSR